MKATMWTKVRRAASVASMLGVSGPLALQAQSADCKINDGSPYQVNGAKQYVTQAANSKYPDQVPKLLQNAVRVLTDAPEKINNEAGRQFLLLRAYAQWMQLGGARMIMKRSEVGFTANPQGTHNMLLAIDSSATAVEKLMPQCAATVSPYRTRFLGEILNKSIAALNADQNDSAAYYAQMSLLVASSDPRPWNVLTSVYSKTGKTDSAVIAMERVIQLSGTDTLFTKVQQQSRYNLAVLTLQRAEAEQGAARDAHVAKARTLLEQYLKVTPGDASAQQALGRTLRLSGDTAAVVAIFSQMLTAPGKFTDVQLFEAASSAASSGQDANAVKLFEAGLKKNPYHRVALLNLANVLFSMKDAERMGPIVQRVMALDPNFDNGWRLMAGYWQLRGRSETDAAKKRMYNDSTLFYLQRQEKTNPRVDISTALSNGKMYNVQGAVSNGGTAAASWTIKLELLDAAGMVVATRDVAVGPIDPGSSMAFTVAIEAPTAVGYRYAPVK